MWRRNCTLESCVRYTLAASAHARCEEPSLRIGSAARKILLGTVRDPLAVVACHSLPVRHMAKHRACITSLVLTLGATAALPAQAWPAGSVGGDKTIYAKFYLGVGDAVAPPYPVAGVRLLLVSATSDTVLLTMDAAGAAAAYVPRGDYRLVTLDWVTTSGKNYKWDLPLKVSPAMKDVELNTTNAIAPPRLILSESRAELASPSIVSPKVTISSETSARNLAGRRLMLDSSGFAWEVFEQTFGLGAIWGTALQRPTVEVSLVFNRDQETRQLDHFPANWRALSNEELMKCLDKARRIRP